MLPGVNEWHLSEKYIHLSHQDAIGLHKMQLSYNMPHPRTEFEQDIYILVDEL